jgi:hypothetical protein
VIDCETVFILDAEWDRPSHTGDYSRHSTKEAAEAFLAELRKNDPPHRWRILRRFTCMEQLAAFHAEAFDDGAGFGGVS